MALEDYLEPEVAVTAAVTAVLFSPRGRKWLRQGAVYGLAGVLVAGDAITTFGRRLGQGIQKAGTSARTTLTRAQSAVATGAASASQTHEPDQPASTEGSQQEAGGQQ